MTEDDASSLLTRRQLIGLFGGVGAAIAMGTSAGLNADGGGQGDLTGGAMALSSAFKAGDNLWHGPLSARSEVPQQDGNAYIQTDAGPNSDQYKVFHYDGGWVARGFNTPALTTDRLSTAARGPTFVVHKVGGTTVVDGPTGPVSYTGDDDAAIQAALDALTNGRNQPETVKTIGDFTSINNQINVPSKHAILDLWDARLFNGGGIADSNYMIKVGSAGTETQNVHILGGTLHGDKNNKTNTPGGVLFTGDQPVSFEDRSGMFGTAVRRFSGVGIDAQLRRSYYDHCEVVFAGNPGVRIGDTDITTYRMQIRDADGLGCSVESTWGHHFYMVSQSNNGIGLKVTDERNTFTGGIFETNNDNGILIDVPNAASDNESVCIVESAYVANNGKTAGSKEGIHVKQGRGVTLRDLAILDTESTPTQEDSVLVGSDAINTTLERIYDRDNPESITNNGQGTTIRDAKNLSKGSTWDFINEAGSSGSGSKASWQATDGVSTSATTIFSPGESSKIESGVAVVQGDQRASNARFFDLIFWSPQFGAATISSNGQNTPSGRTYSVSADSLDLAMASNTYDVVAAGLTTRRDLNATS